MDDEYGVPDEDERPRAMTSAERQKKYRDRLKQKKADIAQARGEARMGRPPTSTTFKPGDSYYSRYGHSPNLLHGANSQARIQPRAHEKLVALLSDPDYPEKLKAPAFRSTMIAWSRAEAVADLLWEWLCGQDIGAAMREIAKEQETVLTLGPRTRRKTKTTHVKSALEWYQRASNQANNLRRELGLTPLSRVRMGKELTGNTMGIAAFFAQLEDEEEAAAGRRELTAGESDTATEDAGSAD